MGSCEAQDGQREAAEVNPVGTVSLHLSKKNRDLPPSGPSFIVRVLGLDS